MDDTLCLQLDSLINTNLHTHAKNCRIKDIINVTINSKGEKTAEAHFPVCVSEMHKIAEERANDTKHYNQMAEAFHHASKHELSNDVNCALKCPVLQPSHFANALSSQAASHTCPPKLTENECMLLDKYQGCIKCHHRYQNHHASSCSNGFPDSAGYQELTEEILLDHKHIWAVPAATKLVGMVVEMEDENDGAYTINAIISSCVLDAGDTINEEVCATLISCHF